MASLTISTRIRRGGGSITRKNEGFGRASGFELEAPSGRPSPLPKSCLPRLAVGAQRRTSSSKLAAAKIACERVVGPSGRFSNFPASSKDEQGIFNFDHLVPGARL